MSAELSVVVPVHNEAANLAPLVAESARAGRPGGYESFAWTMGARRDPQLLATLATSFPG